MFKDQEGRRGGIANVVFWLSLLQRLLLMLLNVGGGTMSRFTYIFEREP